MARMEVQPEALSSAGAQQRQVAGRVLEQAGLIAAAGATGAGAAGDGGVAGAISGCAGGWATALDGLAQGIGALGANLDAAAGAYRRTDASAIP